MRLAGNLLPVLVLYLSMKATRGENLTALQVVKDLQLFPDSSIDDATRCWLKGNRVLIERKRRGIKDRDCDNDNNQQTLHHLVSMHCSKKCLSMRLAIYTHAMHHGNWKQKSVYACVWRRYLSTECISSLCKMMQQCTSNLLWDEKRVPWQLRHDDR